MAATQPSAAGEERPGGALTAQGFLSLQNVRQLLQEEEVFAANTFGGRVEVHGNLTSSEIPECSVWRYLGWEVRKEKPTCRRCP